MRLSLLISLCLSAVSSAAQQSGWRMDPRPVLTLGAEQDDTTQLFAVVSGAARLPNGDIIVADRGAMNLHLFAPDGKKIKSTGRKGAGPGEFGYLARATRCGDSLVASDIDGYRMSVFRLDGTFVRHFRFATPELGSQVPYASACNATLTFVHNGWGDHRLAKPPSYRTSVDYWLSGADSSVRRVLGRFPGSERYVLVVDGAIRGTRPLPFGKQTSIAIGSDRVYVGTGDTYEIHVFSLTGAKLPSVVKQNAPPSPVTGADIDAAREKEIATSPPARRKGIEADWAKFPFPALMPAYARTLVDSDDNLWVQDFPRVQNASVRWTVFSPKGAQVAEVMLPRDLEPYEIGKDYILGRYLDPDEGIPQVRRYRLARS